MLRIRTVRTRLHFLSCQWSSTLQMRVELNRGSCAAENLQSSLVRATFSSSNCLHLLSTRLYSDWSSSFFSPNKFSFRALHKYCSLSSLRLGRFSERILINHFFKNISLLSSFYSDHPPFWNRTFQKVGENLVVPGSPAVWNEAIAIAQ